MHDHRRRGGFAMRAGNGDDRARADDLLDDFRAPVGWDPPRLRGNDFPPP